MNEFFYMDGYWMFVWPSFLLTFLVLAEELVRPWLRHRRLRRELSR